MTSYIDKTYVAHLITPKTITVVLDEGNPVSIVKHDGNAQRFDSVVEMLLSERYDEVPGAIDRAIQVAVISKGKFVVVDNIIVIDGEDLPGALSNKLLDLVDANESTDSLENFWDNLRENPTESSVEDLYSFLVANNVPITKDGCFVVYKRVKDDYWDSHTGRTHQSTIGSVIEMPRDMVDSNRRNTCSTGLHVAAFEYASNFSGSRLLECKVNPKDVVAVPPDYENQKMRVCRYEVLRETTEKFVEAVYEEAAPTPRLEGGVFKPLRLSLDSRGRLRIPGAAIRKIGAGVGYSVKTLVKAPSCRHILITFGKRHDANDLHATRTYTVDDDNSIRISSSMLAEAKIDEYEGYIVRLKNDELEIRVG